MNTYEVRMTLRVRHVVDKNDVKTSETELVDYVDANGLTEAFTVALNLRDLTMSSIKENVKSVHEMDLSLDAVVRKP